MPRGLPAVAELARRPITTGLVLAAIATTLLWESGFSIDALAMSPRAVGTEPWRLLTSALPHVGFLHLAFNAYWTLVLGGAIEARCGAPVTALLVLGTAIASAALEHALFAGGVGLSGVGYGLFGFAWVASKRHEAFEDVVDAATVQDRKSVV
jgi:membrane associated rhomboid family serine protease